MKDLHPYASQRLVNLFDSVRKRYIRLFEGHRQVSLPSVLPSRDGSDGAEKVTEHIVEDTKQALEDELLYTEDLVRMILEIFSLAFTVGDVAENPHLIYSILHKKVVFEHFLKEPFKSSGSFWEPLSRLDSMLKFFEEKVSAATVGQTQGQTFEEVLSALTPTLPPTLTLIGGYEHHQ